MASIIFDLNKQAYLRRYPKAEHVFEPSNINPSWINKPVMHSPEIIKELHDVIVIGMGDGKHIQQILQSLPQSGSLLLIEPYSKVIQIVLNSMDFRTAILDNRLNIICSRDKQEIAVLIGQYLFMRKSKETKQIINPLYSDIPEVLEMSNMIDDVFNRHIVNEVTVIKRGREFISQALKNIGHLETSLYLDDIKDIYKGKTGVVCAAAPSLTDHLSYLKENQDKLVICGVDAALPVLTKAGITPDFGCSVDPADNKIKSFTDANLTDDTINIGIMKCSAGVLDAMGNRKIVTTESGAIIGLLQMIFEKQNILEGGALSVSHFAWHILKYCGCSPIILVGNDLCFDIGGRTHAEGVEYSTGGKVAWQSDYAMIKCNDGETRPTWNNFKAFAQLYEDIIYIDKVQTFNASKKGAMINNAPYIDLNEYELPDEAFEKIHRKIAQEYDDEDKVDYIGYLTKLKNIFRKSRTLFKYALKSNKDVEWWLAGRLNDVNIDMRQLNELSNKRNIESVKAFKVDENNPIGITELLSAADYKTQIEGEEILRAAVNEHNPMRVAMKHVEYYNLIYPSSIETCEWWIKELENVITNSKEKSIEKT